MMLGRLLVAMLLAGVHSLPAQEPAPARVPAAGDTKPLQYRLGAGDELVVRVFNLEELSGGGVPSATGASEVSYRVDESGQLALPVIGLLAVGGKTLEQVRAEITARCKQYLKDPQVTVEIKVFKSRPVSVFGQVKTPGVFQLEGGKTIVELLSLAGGLTDSAGAVVQVTRRMSEGPIPLANAEVQDNGAYSTARLSLSDLMAGGPAATLTARPYDVITVPTSPTVYVLGSLQKPGGFMLKEHVSMSVLEAIAAAQGLDKDAAPEKARLLRPAPGTDMKTEMALDVKEILKGVLPDVALQPGDVLFVPSKTSWRGTVGKIAAIVAGPVAGAAMYRY